MYLLIFAASILVFLFSLFPVTDFDIWFHLAEGKFMIENWQFPRTEMFSYSAYGTPLYSNSWGFDALSAITFKIFGLDGLNALKALIPAAILLVAALYLQKKKLLNIFSLSFIAIALFSIREGFSLRPHTFAYLIFIVFLILLFQYKEQKKHKYIIFLAILQFIWVNFHASFIWGVAFSGILLVSDLATERKIDRKNIILAGAIFIASLSHIFYGYEFFIRTIKNYFAPYYLPIRESLAATPETFISLAGLMALSLFVVMYASVRQKHFHIGLIALLVAAAAIKNVRFTRDLILFLALTAPVYFPYIKEQLVNIKILPPIKFKIPPAFLKYSFAALLLILFISAKNADPGIGLGLEKFSYPVKAVEFIKNEKLLEESGGNLYNTYNFGGYLMWTIFPNQIFIDGRMQPYEGRVSDIYWSNFEGGDSWKNTVEKYDVTVALMTMPHTDGATVYNDSSKMFPKEDWALIYYDDIGMIYIRRINAFDNAIERYEYKFLNPQAMDFSYFDQTIKSQTDFDKALQEIKTGLELNPESYRLHFTLSYLYNISGMQKEMARELEKTLEINPRFKAARDILSQYNSALN